MICQILIWYYYTRRLARKQGLSADGGPALCTGIIGLTRVFSTEKRRALSAPGCPPGGTHHPPRAAGPDAACSAAHIPPPLPGPLLHSPWRHPWRASQLIVASNNDSCPALHTTNISRRRTSCQAAQAKQGCEDARDGTARAAGPTAQRKIAPPSSVGKTLENHHLMQTPAPYPNIPATQHNGRRKDKKSPLQEKSRRGLDLSTRRSPVTAGRHP